MKNPLSYEDRKRIIAHWLKEFLSRFEVPKAYDKIKAREEMVFMVEDINSELPSKVNDSYLKFCLSNMAQHIRKHNISRTWPTIKNFMTAIKEIERPEPEVGSDLSEFSLAPLAINAKKIKLREPVGDYYITGGGAKQLLDQGLVSEGDLETYTLGLEMMVRFK